MTRVVAGEVTLGAFPVNEAVMECDPACKDTDRTATLFDIVAVPSVVVPSINVTVPLALGNCSLAVTCTPVP